MCCYVQAVQDIRHLKLNVSLLRDVTVQGSQSTMPIVRGSPGVSKLQLCARQVQEGCKRGVRKVQKGCTGLQKGCKGGLKLVARRVQGGAGHQ